MPQPGADTRIEVGTLREHGVEELLNMPVPKESEELNPVATDAVAIGACAIDGSNAQLPGLLTETNLCSFRSSGQLRELVEEEPNPIVPDAVVIGAVAVDGSNAQLPGLQTETNLRSFLQNSGQLRELVKEAIRESCDLRQIVTEAIRESPDLRQVITEVVQELLPRAEGMAQAEEADPEQVGIHLALRKDDVDVHVPFEANTWSAFYLFFVTLENGKGVYTKFEQYGIVATIVLTWLVQFVLVAVIWTSLNENPYNAQAIHQILRFRILHGHGFENVQGETGKSFMDVFCNEDTTPWSWESEEYETISKYLKGTIPGWTLTFLALIGWVCCCASEFRTTVEQALATMHLEPPRSTSEGTRNRKYVDLKAEEMSVVSLTLPRKMAVLMLISVPRLVIMMLLLYTGCLYLCYTASLEDLVLNAMALIFVIEFDELIFSVFVTARAQKIVSSVQPLTFPVYKLPWGLVLKDLLRMIFIVVALVLSCTYALAPFVDSVKAAKYALCEGDLSVSYKANTPLSFIHVLQHGDNFAQCPPDSHDYQSYFKETYNVSVSRENAPNPEDPDEVQNKRIKFLLEYVFRDQTKEELPTMLTLAMGDAEPGTGISAQPETCSSFRPSMGMQSCRKEESSDSQVACAWPYRAYLCEGWPAFGENRVKAAACAAKPSAKLSCDLWEMGGHSNATKKADPFSFCRAERISGSFSVNFGRMTPEQLRQLQGGKDIVANAYVHFGILGQFVGWGRNAGEVRGNMQPCTVPEVCFTLHYDILIPFPNNGFLHSSQTIYNDLRGLASDTSNTSRVRFVELFEKTFTDITSKNRKGCLLVVENASVPTWTAMDTDLVTESPREEDSNECGKVDQCVDLPGWQLNDEINCVSFEANGWCKNGGQGSWSNPNGISLPQIKNADGVSVVSACCVCGGGTSSAGKAARQLIEASSVIRGKEQKPTLNILRQPVVGMPLTVLGEPDGADMLAAASSPGFVAATSQAGQLWYRSRQADDGA
eukprot:TRINITY_DN19652_c0_g2_i1.p1 TRINITY_DN19652_c0_g2~~TRINITY_DN19652_c0_g2_i1.p1  ORF type:complete len:996 (-),score=141.55 TRINITY_DN19652_c0_g2_i1:205-3192(-)